MCCEQNLCFLALGTLLPNLQYELLFDYTFYCPGSLESKSPNVQLCKNSVGQRSRHRIIES